MRKGKATLVLLAVTTAAALGAVAAVATSAGAATGCSVTYSVSSQWPGGFTGNVAVTNLGDPLNGWTVRWNFTAGQTVTQGWNATITPGTSTPTATNPGWAPTLGTNATASFGFNGSWNNSANPAPTGWTLNGVACTGGVSTTGPTAPTVPTTRATTPPTTRATTPPTTRATTPPTTRVVTTPPTTTPPTSGWNPPSNLVQPLNEVWAHVEQTYNNGNPLGFRNYGWDQVMANGGYINYCVRWDSSASVSTALRDQIHAKIAHQNRKWFSQMVGHNNWPYADVPIRVVGWAVRDRNQLQWSDTSVDIYVNNIRENAPQCSEPCGRFFNQSGNYPNCPGGVSRHYDQSLWLTDGFGGGAGGDWGQRMGREYFVNNINAENMTILLHELGHTYGLDDFYDWSPTGVGGFIMKAGSSAVITEFDIWMYRDWWRHLKSRYGR